MQPLLYNILSVYFLVPSGPPIFATVDPFVYKKVVQTSEPVEEIRL